MTKPVISASVPEEMEEEVDEYKEENGYSRSEAIRNLIETGLEVESSEKAVISGEVIADGGEIRGQIGELAGQQEKAQQLQNAILLTGLAWVVLQVATGLGTVLTLATGVPLIALLVWVFYRTY